MEAKHTETPWKVEGMMVTGLDGRFWIADFDPGPEDNKDCERLHNVDYAVRAVNAHEALMGLREEVRLLLCALDSAQTYSARRQIFSFGYGGLNNALNKANAALALAEKENRA